MSLYTIAVVVGGILVFGIGFYISVRLQVRQIERENMMRVKQVFAIVDALRAADHERTKADDESEKPE